MFSLAKSQVSTKSISILFIKLSSLFLPYIYLVSSAFRNKVMSHIKKIDFFFPEYQSSSDEYRCDLRKKRIWLLVFKYHIAAYTQNSRVF